MLKYKSAKGLKNKCCTSSNQLSELSWNIFVRFLRRGNYFLPKNATESDSMTVTKWTLGVEVDVTPFIYIVWHFNQSTKRSSSTCSDDSISNFSSRPWSAPPWMLKIIELSWAGPRLADWLTQIKSRWIITFAPCVFSAGRRQSADRVSVGELWSDGGADQRRLP